MRIVFFGSDDFAATHLSAILKTSHQVLAVVTGPDKPQGRGMKMTVSAPKEMALEHSIECLQPPTLKDPSIVEKLKTYAADLFVVVAYGRLLTQEILDIPKIFCVNVHGSLLPKYRGAAPINWAILNDDDETGVTIQKMALRLDAGDIIAQEYMRILPEETSYDLRLRMADVGAKLLCTTLDQIEKSHFKLLPQDEALVSFAPKLTKEMAIIDWNKSAAEIHNQIRGLQPWPGAHTFYGGKILKILQATVINEFNRDIPGSVMSINKNGIQVAAAQGSLMIHHVHPEASKPMPAQSFAVGHQLKEGDAFRK